MRSALALVVCAWLAAPAFAAEPESASDTLTVIPLHHRTAEDLLPQLAPLVEGRGAITGTGDQIFLRSTPEVADEIRELVMSLDRVLRSLWISVRQVFDRRVRRSMIPPTGDPRGGMDVLGTRFQGFESGVQAVRTLEGKAAEIAIERDVPHPDRRVVLGGAAIVDDWYYETLGRGFSVIPRLWQDHVSLEIVTRLAPASGNGERLEIRTSVDAKLGEWTEIGHVLEEHAARGSGPHAEKSREERTRASVLVKVERLDTEP
jgi:hypothetical protein